MGGKAKSRCHLGMLKIGNLWNSNLNKLKLVYCGPAMECLNNNC